MISIRMLLKFVVVAGFGFMLLYAQEDKESTFMPAWVGGDYASHWNGKVKDRICGVGFYSRSTDIAELRTRAIEAAKEKIAKDLEARVQAVVEHYGKSRHGHKDFGKPPDLKQMKKTSEQITSDAMQFSEINSYWITPENEVYTLISLTATELDDAIGRMEHLSEPLRKELHKHADKMIEHVEEHLRKLLEEETKQSMEKEAP